jgi:hypothetical protein
MSAASRMNTLRAVLRLLERQRQSLRQGDFAGLQARTARIEALCAQLEASDGPAPAAEQGLLVDLRRQATLSLRQIAAALEGLRDAQALIAAARAPAPDRVYGPDGASRALGAATGRLELRR